MNDWLKEIIGDSYTDEMDGKVTAALTENDEFPTGVLYEFPEAAQPEISETASTTAPTGGELVKSQQTNVTQIFHESIEITYARLANRGKLSGLNTAGAQPEQPNEEDFQICLLYTSPSPRDA